MREGAPARIGQAPKLIQELGHLDGPKCNYQSGVIMIHVKNLKDPQRILNQYLSIEACLYLFIIHQLTNHQRQQQAPKPKATITTSSNARKPYGWLMRRSIAPWWVNTLRFIDKLTNTKKNGFQVSTWKVLPVLLEQQILNQKDTGYAPSVSRSRLDILLVSREMFWESTPWCLIKNLVKKIQKAPQAQHPWL